MPSDRLRVAFVAGTLAQGGAEKQLVYMAIALQQSGVDARVYCLRRGEHFESVLRNAGVDTVWVGQRTAPVLRLAALSHALGRFRPHIVQAAHFYANLYSTAAARLCGALAIGTVRGDAVIDLRENGAWGRWLLKAPPVLITNSETARRNAIAQGVRPAAVHVVANVLGGRDRPDRPGQLRDRSDDAVRVVAVASLIRAKRLDRFLAALAAARRDLPRLQGMIAGEGGERRRLEAQAAAHGLLPDGVRFLGRCADVASLLAGADMLVLTSDNEGFPNALLEAMEAGIPIVTTPAGDAGQVVVNGETGYVVDFEDGAAMAERIVRLGSDPELRARLGSAGRRRVRTVFGSERLGERLLDVYRVAATGEDAYRVLRALQQTRAGRSELCQEQGCPA